MEQKNVGELLTVSYEDLNKQKNQTILGLVNDLAIKNQQVSQLMEAYSTLDVELTELKNYLQKVHPAEFKKLYESEVEKNGTTENANADTGLAENDNI